MTTFEVKVHYCFYFSTLSQIIRMKKILISILSLFLYLPLATAADIQGKIISSTAKTPIEFINVALFKKGQPKPITGVATNKDGIFRIPSVTAGSYSVRISFVGYKTQNKAFTVSSSDINFGIIEFIEDSKILGAVEVIGQGTQMRMDVDKKIFSVDQNIAAAGGSASDVLKNIPSVKVDNEGNVSLRKDGNVEIWVNGKPSGLNVDNRAQVLQQMPAESIESIEVMTNPSAKFNPEGTAGIINIVMKKNRKAGYYGSLSTGAFYPDGGKVTPTAGASINYSSTKLDAYANIGYRAMSFKGSNINERYTLNDINRNDTLSLLSQTGVLRNEFSGVFMRAGLDYHLDSLNTIGVSGFGMAGTGESSNNINYQLTDLKNNVGINNFSRLNAGTGTRPNLNLNIDYKRDIDSKGSNLLASVAYSSSERGMNNTSIQKNAIEDIVSNITQETEGKSIDVTLKADYTKKFTEKNKLEAGWQSNFSNRLSTANAFDNTKLVTVDSYKNNFNYEEQIHAGYVTYGGQFNKLTIQGGLRAEYIIKNWVLITPSNPDVTSTYKPSLQLFPSLFMAYSLPNNNELQLNYSRRVNRPRGRQISPFRDYSDSTNISYGNPSLVPEYASVLEFNYMKTWDNHSISASAYYRYTDNVIEDVHFINNKTMESTYMNIAKVQNSGVELVGKNSLFSILNLTSTLNFYYSKMDSSVYTNPYASNIKTTIPAQSTFTWSANVMANFMLGKTLSGQITGEYSAPTLIAQGIESPEYSIDFGLRKTFFDKKFSVSVIAADIFNLNKERTTTWGTGFYQMNQSYFHRRMLGITLTYNFGNMKPKMTEMKKKESGGEMNMDMGE